MQFTYTAKTKNGEIVKGALSGTDRFSVSNDLRKRGLVPIVVNAGSSGNDPMDFINKLLSSVSISELIVFTKNLSGMIKAGLSLYRALSVLQKQTKNKKFEEILSKISSDINSGGSFSDSLEKFPKVFSTLFISMVKAGEESGNLAGALREIGLNLEKANALTKKVKGALVYPGVILSAMLIVGILMFAFVVPTLAKTFVELGIDLPPATRFIIGLGDFFSNNLLLSLLGAAGLIFGTMYLFKAPFMAKYIDFIVLRIPVVGVMAKEINSARTARTLSSLIVAGVPIVRAIEITSNVVQNIYYRKVLNEAKEVVEKGFPISDIFTEYQGLYPVMMSEMIQVGEETGKLSDMLMEIALYYENETENKTKNLSTIIEPVLMILIGAGVGFFAISMVSPMYSILDGIS
jgi:type IV pilus assembly protein PilC